MKTISYNVETDVNRDDLLDLYGNANWTAYTNDPDRLSKAVRQSLKVITAREGSKLVGLVRAIGDGQTILYIQDILVHSEYKRNGIGRKLMELILDEFSEVRQKVLLTDDNPETRGFYESMGFDSCDKGQLVSFVKLENSPTES
jgi:ribosomal protein S18 acetylase RimI-like enzyme